MDRGDWIQTFTGRRFYAGDPRPEDVHPGDVAHALSMLCRFGGHCLRFYSVAEHCVLMSRAVPRSAHADLPLWCLLHDAAEAYLVDVPKPVKNLLGPAYKAVEARVQRACYDRFGLIELEPPAVKDLDRRILETERSNMARCEAEWRRGAEPLGVTLRFWTPPEAELEYLAELTHLTGGRT